MKHNDPTRLFESDEAPDALRQALRALRDDKPGTEAINRIQHTLGSLPKGVTGAGGLGGSGGLTALTVGGMVAAAVLIGVGLRSNDQQQPDVGRPARAARMETAPVGQAVTGRPAVQKTIRDGLESEDTGPSPQLQPTDQALRAQPAATAMPSESKDGRSHVPAATDSPQAGARKPREARRPKGERIEADEGTPPVAVSREAPVHAPEAHGAPPPEVDHTPAPGPEPQDEAGLLYQAKRVAGRDPRAALKLLAEHRFYFPDGALGEEREVMAIELYRRLGQLDEAQRRSDRFRKRYPNSVYHRSLSP